MLLSLDVGFANMGWAVFHNKKPVALGSISSSKSKRKGLRVADDNADRAIYISSELNKLIYSTNCSAIIGELPSGGSQNAKAAYQMGIATGIVSALVSFHGLPCEWCIPGDIKKAVTGKRNATKEEIMDTVASKYEWLHRKKGNSTLYYTSVGTFNKGSFEHIADAIGTYWALQNNNLVKMFG